MPDIRPDSANDQDSDGRELNSEKKVGNSLLDLLPVEILEKVFLYIYIYMYVMKISNFSFPGHVCWTFNHALATIPQLERFNQGAIEFRPSIDFSDITDLPKPRPNSQVHINL